jgi:hypothetical protein
MRRTFFSWACCIVTLMLVCATHAFADPIAVRAAEGAARADLVLRSADGKILANGDLAQSISGDRVTSHLVFRFADGSVHDETTVFSQTGTFRLLNYHLIQRGPSFRWTLDMTMNTQTGEVVVRHRDKDGDEGVDTETLHLAADVGNGMMVTVLKNLSAKSAAASFVAATPGPRPVKLAISAIGSEAVSTGGSSRQATHYVIKAEIGGIAGVVAPLVGKQPPDTHVWILEGTTPAFVKSEGPLFYGGPVWRIETR